MSEDSKPDLGDIHLALFEQTRHHNNFVQGLLGAEAAAWFPSLGTAPVEPARAQPEPRKPTIGEIWSRERWGL